MVSRLDASIKDLFFVLVVFRWYSMTLCPDGLRDELGPIESQTFCLS